MYIYYIYVCVCVCDVCASGVYLSPLTYSTYFS